MNHLLTRIAVTSALMSVVVYPSQALQEQFEVAAIRENHADPRGQPQRFRVLPDGSVMARRVRGRAILTTAFQIQSHQLVAAPPWLDGTYYDIDAKPSERVARDRVFPMLRGLLHERFGLAYHEETRQLPGFALVRVHPDRFGPNLRRSELNCENDFAAHPRCRDTIIGADDLTAVGLPIRELLTVLMASTNAPIRDETNLEGVYDFSMTWSTEVTPSDDRPALSTAVQEQLGLRLQRQVVETRVIVIDHIDRPTPN